MPTENAASIDAPLLVACLCAAWCGSCREYAGTFAAAAVDFGARGRFRQIDIEDEADMVDGIDVENFPTLLIARAGTVLFFGPVTPHAQTLARLVERALAGELGAVAAIEPPVAALASRLGAAD